MNKSQKKFKKIIKKRQKVRRKEKTRTNFVNHFKKMILRWKLIDVLKRKIHGPIPEPIEPKDLLLEEAMKIEPYPIMDVVYSTDIEKLREKSKPVTTIDKEFLERLGSTLVRSNGAAIAAIQVGRPEQYVVIRTERELYPMINPVVKKEYWQKDYAMEGCLSLSSEKPVLVPRPKYIIIDFMDEDGTKYENVKFSGLMARIIKHELDHINGIIVLDYAEK